MEQSKVEEGNRLIAEFMGWKKETRMWRMHERVVYSSNSKVLNNTSYDGSSTVKSMKFHKSWDWLMPVVEKIQDRGLTVQTTALNPYVNTDIKDVWGKTIDVIKMINKRRNKNPLNHTPTPEESPYLYKRKEIHV